MITKLKHIRPLSGVAIVPVLTTSCASRRLSAVGGQAALGCTVDPNVICRATVVPAQNSISCEILGCSEFGVMKCTN
jgi:hypothetical protein